MGRKLGGGLGPHLTQCGLAEANSVPSGIYAIRRLATIGLGLHEPKSQGPLCPVFFGGGELGTHLTHIAWAKAYFHTKWHPALATRDKGRKLGAVPLGELGSHLTQCGRGEAPISMPSFVSIHPTVSPQYGTPMLETDRTTVR